MADEFKFKIEGQIDAKCSGWEASCAQTITGVEWTLRGNLATAVRSFADKNDERWAEAARMARDGNWWLLNEFVKISEDDAAKRCSDCPPENYPTDKTRCSECPLRRAERAASPA